MDPLYLALLLYLAAAVLATVDLLIPSGGLLLVLACLAAFGSVLLGFRAGTNAGMVMLTLVTASVPAFIFAAIKIWPHTPIGRRIILRPPEKRDDGDATRLDPLLALVGQVAVTETAFLPSGQLRIGHRRYNAIAENGLIEAGERVQVISVRERILIIRTTSEPLASHGEGANGIGSENEQNQSLLDRPAEELGLNSIDE